MLVRMAQAVSLRSCAPVTLDELLLTKSHAQQPNGTPCKILSSLSFLLRRWKIQCLNLTDYKMAAQSLVDLLNHQGALTIRCTSMISCEKKVVFKINNHKYCILNTFEIKCVCVCVDSLKRLSRSWLQSFMKFRMKTLLAVSCKIWAET